MADLSITPANVVAANTKTITANGISGAAVLAGQAVWLDTSVTPNQLKPASATTLGQANSIVGLALNTVAGANEALTYATSGDVIVGSGPSAGTVYVVSDGATPGNLTAANNVASNSFVSVVALATNSTTLRLGLNPVAAKR